MRNAVRSHAALSGFAVFVMIALYVLMAFMLTLMGAQGYRTVAERSEVLTRERILRNYVTNRLRAADGAGGVSIETDFGTDIVRIHTKKDQSLFTTRIYCFNGWLMESFTEENAAFRPELGEKLCEADDMQVSFSEGLYEITITASGRAYTSYVAPVSARR